MNLKYYLRGLGLGIIITAIIMGVAAGGKKETLTNDEIIARAKELGMIENKVLTDYMEEIKAEETAENSEPPEPQAAGNQNNFAADAEGNDISEEAMERADEQQNKETPDEEDDDLDATADLEEAEEAELTIFLIRKGETPYKICERLAEKGLVSSADDFDTFLLNNGYDRKIVASEYSIPANADEETIAKIITGKKIE